VTKTGITNLKTYNIAPTPVITRVSTIGSHHVSAFFVVVRAAQFVRLPRRNNRNAIERFVSLDGVIDLLGRCCLEGFLVRPGECSDRAAASVGVTSQGRGVVRTFMVITETSFVKTIDSIRARNVTLPQMRSTVRGLVLVLDLVQWSDGRVTGESLHQ